MPGERDYPVLFGTTQADWAPIYLRFLLLEGAADERLVARVYVVPFVGDACVVVGFGDGGWGPAGGGMWGRSGPAISSNGTLYTGTGDGRWAPEIGVYGNGIIYVDRLHSRDDLHPVEVDEATEGGEGEPRRP